MLNSGFIWSILSGQLWSSVLAFPAGSMLLAFPVNRVILNFDYIIILAIFVNYKYEYLL
jgi:hypothetical protein